MSCSYFTFSAGECGAGNSAFRCMAMKHVEHWAKTWFVINKVGDKTFQRGDKLGVRLCGKVGGHCTDRSQFKFRNVYFGMIAATVKNLSRYTLADCDVCFCL